VQAGIEAWIEFVPAVAEPVGANAVALLACGRRPAVMKAFVEILLAAEVRPPRRHPERTVVQRAEDLAPLRISLSAQQHVPGGRSGQGDRRARRDAARVARRAQDFPGAIPAAYLDHRQTMRVLRLEDLFARPGLHAIRKQQALIGVLMVDDQ